MMLQGFKHKLIGSDHVQSNYCYHYKERHGSMHVCFLR